MTPLEEKLKRTLNPEQFEASMHMEGPAAIMAGAGSGKTHTLMNRVAHLIDSGVNPERILMLTFTNAAADEMKRRSTTVLDDRCKSIVACTYHKFCNMMLRSFGRRIGLRDYTVLSAVEGRNLIVYVKSSDPELSRLKYFPTSQTIENLMSTHVNTGADISEMLAGTKYEHYTQEIIMFIEKVERYRFRRGKLNYDDLLVYMEKLLRDPESCRRIAGMYDYIMVDEYQDTNNLQEEIIAHLFEYNKNIAVVGDISQSIYGFRGANVDNLKNFSKRFTGCRVLKLSRNYRSTQEILNLANNVMKKNVVSWDYFDMNANNKNGRLPEIVKTMDETEQCFYVIDKIQKYHQEGIPYKNIAVLERSSRSSFMLEKELNLAGIPFDKRGGKKFLDYECVGDLLGFMTVIQDPKDNISWFRILKLLPGIGDIYARRIADGCHAEGFLTDAKLSRKPYYKELEKLSKAYTDFKDTEDFHVLVSKLIRFYLEYRKHIIDVSKLNDENTEKAINQLENDKEIAERFREMTVDYDNLISFLDDLVLDSLSELESEEDKLMISTVHSAKGLEWDAVFIIDSIEGRFPAQIWFEDRGSPADEEELRCFYVAMTRAKDMLHICCPLTIRKGMEDVAVEPTHYLDYFIDDYLV